jgi:dihydroflavonol-4-reductase
MKILVTGGSGFIGRHLVAALLMQGDSVRVFDIAAPAGTSGPLELIQGSILDRAALLRALEGMDRVYHLAGIAHLWSPGREDFDRVNRSGTEMLLSAARQSGVSRILHCSTEAILLPADRRSRPIDETVSLDLSDMPGPYTRSKYAAEQAALSAARAGLPVIIVNPTIPIGPGDHRMTPPTAMLARWLDAWLPASLDCVLNVADVRDMAQGMILAAEHGILGERYILGGENLSMRELAAMIGSLTGKRAAALWIPPLLALAAGAASEWLATNVTRNMPIATTEGVRLALRSQPLDSGKARRGIGYAPGPVKHALAEAIDWLVKQERNLAR